MKTEIEEIINTKGSEKDKTLLDRLKEQARRGDNGNLQRHRIKQTGQPVFYLK